MRKMVLILIILTMFLMISGCGTDEPQKPVKNYVDVTAEQAKELIETNNELIVLDVSQNYDAGHLPNAINIYVDELEGRLDELDKMKPILVYCHFDSASMQGAQILIDNEYEEVYRLQGNYSAWKEAGYDIEIITMTYEDLKPNEAYKLINSRENLQVLDVSPHYDDGHLPNATSIYIAELQERIGELNQDEPFLVYCHVDSVSIQGAEILVENGFREVYRLEGNYATWYEGGYPIEIELHAVGEYSGNGVAVRSYLEGEFLHTVKVDLEDPPKGKFYEGWLVKAPDFFSTGKLEKQDGKYSFIYTSDTDYRDYMKVVITEETEANGLDGIAEIHVLENEFK